MPQKWSLIQTLSIRFGITFISQFQLIPPKLSDTPTFNPFNSLIFPHFSQRQVSPFRSYLEFRSKFHIAVSRNYMYRLRYSALAITDGKKQLSSILPSKSKSSTANFCRRSFIYNSLWTFLYFVEYKCLLF